MDDAHVNAASGGGGEFYVTTGLLQKANDDQLRAVLAHELAHDDLGHVAKAQSLGARLGIGMIILGTQERVDALNQLQPEVYELVEPENRCPEAFKE